MGALLCLGFHCFLRTGEMLTIRPCDLVLGGRKGVLRLPSSKGCSRNNVQESITIDNPVVIDILHEMLEMKKSLHLTRVPIWTGSGTKFRQEFAKQLKFFKVDHLKFRCYSVRRGGATAFFKACGSLERTLLRGRWSSIGVARIYLCDGLAQLSDLRASAETGKLVQRFRAFLSTP